MVLGKIGTHKMLLLHLPAKIYENLHRNNPSLCIFLDLAKAFDTVSHSMMLEALQDIGVNNVELNLFKSYLSNRKQQVKIGNQISLEKSVEWGVPQGTVLGPIH